MKKRQYLLVLVMACLLLFVTSCTSTGNGDFFTELSQREGMAAGRLLASPLNMVGFSYAEIQEYAPTSVLLFPFVLCYTVPAGAVAMCGDILTGCAEMISGQQFDDVMYPWDSFDLARTKGWRDQSREIFLDACLAALEGAGEALNEQSNASQQRSAPRYNNSSVSQNTGYSGAGRIEGPSRLQMNKTGIYQLYIGGKKVTDPGVRWRAQGTCITVSDNGYRARVMGGMPPGSSTTTRLEAHFNGRVYTRSITVYR